MLGEKEDKTFKPAFDIINYDIFNIIKPLEKMPFDDVDHFETIDIEDNLKKEYSILLNKFKELDTIILNSSANIKLINI